jgi:hypothetical protein
MLGEVREFFYIRLRSNTKADTTPEERLSDVTKGVAGEGVGGEKGLTVTVGGVGVGREGKEDDLAQKLGRETFEHA